MRIYLMGCRQVLANEVTLARGIFIHVDIVVSPPGVLPNYIGRYNPTALHTCSILQSGI